MSSCRPYFLSLLLALSYFQGAAQRLQDWLDLGDAAMASGDPGGALYYYQAAMNLDSSKGTVNFKFAEALRLNHHYAKAAYHYDKVYRRERGKLFPLSGFWLAQMQKQAGHYKEAKSTWRRVRDQHRTDTSSFIYRKAVQEMRAIDRAKIILSDSIKVPLSPPQIKLNTEASEFAGLLTGEGGILFSSLRGESGEHGEIKDASNYLVKMYRADSSGTVEIPVDGLPADVHLGNLTLVPNSDTVYFSVCNHRQVCSIYGGVLRSGRIATPFEIENLRGDTLQSFTQPAFAVVGGQAGLFIVSQGAEGNFDIYRSEQRGGRFAVPYNLGPPVNTPGNEVTPWYDSQNNTLYFSSDWHYGLGGFDIFSSEQINGVWQRPENLGLDFNSSANDLYFWLNPETRQGLLSSNREADYCCSDLYQFELPTFATDSLPEINTLEELNAYLPVTLYFDNDRPNPRSTDTSTALNYLDTYFAYTDLLPVYERAYSKGLSDAKKVAAEEEMDRFFVEEVDKGVADLELFSRLLLRELEEGAHIEMTLQAFASPLAETDYNLRLSARRIASLENYFRQYEGGAFLPYFSGTGNGQLELIRISYGEYSAAETISDNPNEDNAVYGIAAARERRIQIVEVNRSNKDSVTTLLITPPLQLISDTGAVIFELKNTGNIALEIDSVTHDLNVSHHLDINHLKPGSKALLQIKLQRAPARRHVFEIRIFSKAGLKTATLIYDPKTATQN